MLNIPFKTILIFGPVNLSDKNWARLRFSYWLESELYHDFLECLVSIDGENFYGDALSGTERLEWKSQWSGYNKVFYNPHSKYHPWPNKNDASTTEPRGDSHNETDTLDLSAVPLIKELSHLPVIVDPSHATGKWNLVAPMSKAAVACGCDGLLIEVHNNPEEALSDGPQQLVPERFSFLMKELRELVKVVGRSI